MSSKDGLFPQDIAAEHQQKRFKSRGWRYIEVPSGVHPVTRRMLEALNAQHCTAAELAKRSGVHPTTIREWRRSTIPNVANINACLNVLGLELCVREISK